MYTQICNTLQTLYNLYYPDVLYYHWYKFIIIEFVLIGQY